MPLYLYCTRYGTTCIITQNEPRFNSMYFLFLRQRGTGKLVSLKHQPQHNREYYTLQYCSNGCLYRKRLPQKLQ